MKIKNKTNSKSANGIIVNPRNGDIVGIATVPSFNPNNYFDYNIDTHKNKVISDSYEPGSTFKAISFSTIVDLESIGYDGIKSMRGAIDRLPKRKSKSATQSTVVTGAGFTSSRVEEPED